LKLQNEEIARLETMIFKLDRRLAGLTTAAAADDEDEADADADEADADAEADADVTTGLTNRQLADKYGTAPNNITSTVSAQRKKNKGSSTFNVKIFGDIYRYDDTNKRAYFVGKA
jgi:membrane protein involved in colicin uptake